MSMNNISNYPKGSFEAKALEKWNELSPEQKAAIQAKGQPNSIFKNAPKETEESNETPQKEKDVKQNRETVRLVLPNGISYTADIVDGKEQNRNYFDKNGEPMYSKAYEYDRNNNLKKESTMRKDGTLESVDEYKGEKLIKSSEYDKNGDLKGFMQFSYGGLLSPPKITSYRADGTKETEVIKTKDGEKEIQYAEDGKTVISEE